MASIIPGMALYAFMLLIFVLAAPPIKCMCFLDELR